MYLCLSNWHTFVSWYFGMRKINFLKSNYIRGHSHVAKLAENHSLERVGKECLVISHFYLSLPEPECSICRWAALKLWHPCAPSQTWSPRKLLWTTQAEDLGAQFSWKLGTTSLSGLNLHEFLFMKKNTGLHLSRNPHTLP